MYHFFVAPEQIGEKEIWIEGSDVNHIRNVLRMTPGEKITVSSGADGKEYFCEIRRLLEDQVVAEILEQKEASSELPSKLALFQGLPKSDKMELIIQKAVELGAYEVIPMATHRAVVKLDQKKEESKRKRWNAIAESAAKQSKRTVIPEVTKVFSFREAVTYAVETYDVCLIPYECAEGMEQTRCNSCKSAAGDIRCNPDRTGGRFRRSRDRVCTGKGCAPDHARTSDSADGDSRTCSALGADAAAGSGLSEAIVKQRFERR